MKKTIVFFSVITALSLGVQAQTIQDAVKKTMNERYEAASADFRMLRNAQPGNADVLFYSGDNYYYWNQLDSASQMFSQVVQSAPNNPLGLCGVGRIALESGEAAKAQEHFGKAVALMTAKNTPVDKGTQVVAYLKMAEAYIQNKKSLDVALTYIQAAQKINPNNPEVYIQWGDLNLVNSGSNLTSAIDMYEDSFEKDATYTRALLRQGQLWMRVENHDSALEWFNKAIAQDPTFAPAYRERGELYFIKGQIKEGLESYEKYLELNDDLSARARYAIFLSINRQFELSIAQFEKIKNYNQEDCSYIRYHAYTLHEVGRSAEALTKLQEFFVCSGKDEEKYPAVSMDYAYRGRMLVKTSQDSLAIFDFKKALEMTPDYLEVYTDLGGIYYKQKNYLEASNYYKEKIVRSRVPAPLDVNSLGSAYYRIAESMRDTVAVDSLLAAEQKSWYVKADEQYATLITTWPVFANAWRGRCNSKLDNQEEPTGLAKPFYELAITNAKTPTDVEQNKKDLIEAYSYLGFYHYTHKDFNCSKTSWLKALELDAANEKAKLALTDGDIGAAAGDCQLIPVQ